MRVGVDFDNTLVRYDEVFCDLAFEKGLVTRRGLSKGEVRDHLRGIGREDDWTELQGEVYGAQIGRAPAFPGAAEFLRRCLKEGGEVSVISHKTLRPFRGAPHDLHRAALGWLEANGFFDPARVGLSRDRVFFELTKEAKLARISREGCSVFVDDLPEFLSEPGFPAGVERVLFDPAGASPGRHPFHRASSWADIERWVFDRLKRR